MDFKVEVSFYKLKGLEQELLAAKENIALLEDIWADGVDRITHRQLLEAKQDIIDALKDSKTKVQNELIDANDTISHLRYGSRQSEAQITDLKSALTVEISNVCDLDQEKQVLIEILGDRKDTIAGLKEDINILEKKLAATIARSDSFTLSGNYQITKISQGENLASKRQAESYVKFQCQETAFDNEPETEIGW